MNAGAATADENIYLIGGDNGERAISTTEVFYPGQALTRGPLWEKRMSLPVACRISGIEVIANNIFSLCNNEAGSIFSYSPATDTWQSFTEPKPVDLPQESTIVFHDNYLYYIGGISKSGTPSAANWSNQIFYTLLIPYLKK
jgi:hypothetical protein